LTAWHLRLPPGKAIGARRVQQPRRDGEDETGKTIGTKRAGKTMIRWRVTIRVDSLGLAKAAKEKVDADFL